MTVAQAYERMKRGYRVKYGYGMWWLFDPAGYLIRMPIKTATEATRAYLEAAP